MNQAEMKRRQIISIASMLNMIALLLLGNCMGENGLAYYAAAYEFFWLLWCLAGGSVSDALGRMLRERNARNQYKNVSQMRRYVMLFQGSVGLAVSVLSALTGSLVVKYVFHVPHGSFLVLMLAPMLFLRTIGAVLLGYFQGGGSEFPTVASSVMRPVLFVGFGLLFGNLFKGYGEKVSALLGRIEFVDMHSAIGVSLAACLTEFLLLLFLLILYRGNSGLGRVEQTGMRTTDSLGNVLRVFYGKMRASMLMQALERFPVWLSLILLGKCAAMMEGAEAAYGIFYGRYLALVCAVIFLIDALVVPVSVKVQSYIRRDDLRSADDLFQAGLHGAVVYGIFFAVFVGMMGQDIAALFGKDGVEITAKMFQFGSMIVLFAGVSCFFVRILSLAGKKALIVLSLCVMDLVYLVSVLLFLNLGHAGVTAYVYGGVIASGGLCAVLGFLVCFLLGMRIDWIRTVLIPVGCACVAGLLIMLLGGLIVPHLGYAVTVLVCLAAAWVLYFVLLLLLRNFREQDLKNLPGGVWIRFLGQLLRIYM
ncbi:MAG: hypothetical protein NC417_07930 [Candidatus Gastranaerophilales bacterium]|nr:hypothetical protein [Candidatus Gastranaerophilales bacterium]